MPHQLDEKKIFQIKLNQEISLRIKHLKAYQKHCNSLINRIKVNISTLTLEQLEDNLFEYKMVEDTLYCSKVYNDMLGAMTNLIINENPKNKDSLLNKLEREKKDFYTAEIQYQDQVYISVYRDAEVILTQFLRNKIRQEEFLSWITFYEQMICEKLLFRSILNEIIAVLSNAKKLSWVNVDKVNELISELNNIPIQERAVIQRASNSANIQLTFSFMNSHYLLLLLIVSSNIIRVVNAMPPAKNRHSQTEEVDDDEDNSNNYHPAYYPMQPLDPADLDSYDLKTLDKIVAKYPVAEHVKKDKGRLVWTLMKALEDKLPVYIHDKDTLTDFLLLKEITEDNYTIKDACITLLNLDEKNEIALRGLIFYSYATKNHQDLVRYGRRFIQLDNIEHPNSFLARVYYYLDEALLSSDTANWDTLIQKATDYASQTRQLAIKYGIVKLETLAFKMLSDLEFLRSGRGYSNNGPTNEKVIPSRIVVLLDNESLNVFNTRSWENKTDANSKSLLSQGYGLILEEFGEAKIKRPNAYIVVFEINNSYNYYMTVFRKNELTFTFLPNMKTANTASDSYYERLQKHTRAVINKKWKIPSVIMPSPALETPVRNYLLIVFAFAVAIVGILRSSLSIIKGILSLKTLFDLVKLSNKRKMDTSQVAEVKDVLREDFVKKLTGFKNTFLLDIQPCTSTKDEMTFSVKANDFLLKIDDSRFECLKNFGLSSISVNRSQLKDLFIKAINKLFSEEYIKLIGEDLLIIFQIKKLSRSKYDFDAESKLLQEILIKSSVEYAMKQQKLKLEKLLSKCGEQQDKLDSFVNFDHNCSYEQHIDLQGTLTQDTSNLKSKATLEKFNNLYVAQVGRFKGLLKGTSANNNNNSDCGNQKDIKSKLKELLEDLQKITFTEENTSFEKIEGKNKRIAEIDSQLSNLMVVLNECETIITKINGINADINLAEKKYNEEKRASEAKQQKEMQAKRQKELQLYQEQQEKARVEQERLVQKEKQKEEFKRAKELKKAEKFEKEMEAKREQQEKARAEQERLVQREKLKEEFKRAEKLENERKQKALAEAKITAQAGMPQPSFSSPSLIKDDTRKISVVKLFHDICSILADFYSKDSFLFLTCKNMTANNNNNDPMIIFRSIILESLLYNIMKMMDALGHLGNDRRYTTILANSFDIDFATKIRNNIMHAHHLAENSLNEIVEFSNEIKLLLNDPIKNLNSKDKWGETKITRFNFNNHFIFNMLPIKDMSSSVLLENIRLYTEKLNTFYDVAFYLRDKNFTLFVQCGPLLAAMQSCVSAVGQNLKDLKLVDANLFEQLKNQLTSNKCEYYLMSALPAKNELLKYKNSYIFINAAVLKLYFISEEGYKNLDLDRDEFEQIGDLTINEVVPLHEQLSKEVLNKFLAIVACNEGHPVNTESNRAIFYSYFYLRDVIGHHFTDEDQKGAKVDHLEGFELFVNEISPDKLYDIAATAQRFARIIANFQEPKAVAEITSTTTTTVTTPSPSMTLTSTTTTTTTTPSANMTLASATTTTTVTEAVPRITTSPQLLFLKKSLNPNAHEYVPITPPYSNTPMKDSSPR